MVLLLRNMLDRDEQAAVIADYLNKPKAATRYVEDSVAQLNAAYRRPIFNVCMLESDASLFIQLVDVLLGLVVYDCKLRRRVHPGNAAKTTVLHTLKNHLSQQNLSSTLDGPWFLCCVLTARSKSRRSLYSRGECDLYGSLADLRPKSNPPHSSVREYPPSFRDR